jgi:flagellar biosynthesis protein FlhG
VPQDPALEQAVRQQKPVSLYDPTAKSSRAFEVLAGNLLNGTHDQVQVKWGITQMFSSLLASRR